MIDKTKYRRIVQDFAEIQLFRDSCSLVFVLSCTVSVVDAVRLEPRDDDCKTRGYSVAINYSGIETFCVKENWKFEEEIKKRFNFENSSSILKGKFLEY